MSSRQSVFTRLSTAARWPVGVALTAFRYLWRTTPIHRRELYGSAKLDAPPVLAPTVDRTGVQRHEDGVGPLVHRLYRTRIREARVTPEELIAMMGQDLDRMAPSMFATFQRLTGAENALEVGDDYVVRMPGPWDGPVRVVARDDRSFRLATLEGHLEAGQIEFRATRVDRTVEVVIESWARSGDRLSDLLYTHLRMSKEIQLLMWTSVLETLVRMAGGTMHGGIVVTTRRVQDVHASTGSGPGDRRARRRLEVLERATVNFDTAQLLASEPDDGWRHDDMTTPLPSEPSGPPTDGGSWTVARELMTSYQVADPETVRASYREGPLAGRTMLLEIRYGPLRLHVGVRIGAVYDEVRDVDGEAAHVFGWSYDTLAGHFEEGRMHYEVWKWEETGDVEFRLHAHSRRARSGPALTRAGFHLVGRRQQLDFYRRVGRRIRELTQAELETQRTALASR